MTTQAMILYSLISNYQVHKNSYIEHQENMETKIDFSDYGNSYVRHFQVALDNMGKVNAERHFVRQLKSKPENKMEFKKTKQSSLK